MSKDNEKIKSLLSSFTGVGNTEHEEEPPYYGPVREEPGEQEESSSLLDTIENEELREALKKKRMDGRGRPRKNSQDGKRTDGYSRFTLIASVEKMAKVKEIAFRNTLTQKEVFEEALNLLIEKYEAVHGEVIPEPEKYKGNVKSIFCI